MREREVLLLLLNRLTYEEIAERLFISTNTVKTHVGNVYRRRACLRARSLFRSFKRRRRMRGVEMAVVLFR